MHIILNRIKKSYHFLCKSKLIFLWERKWDMGKGKAVLYLHRKKEGNIIFTEEKGNDTTFTS